MSEKNKKKEDTKENGVRSESDSETDNSSYIVTVESKSSTESSIEKVQSDSKIGEEHVLKIEEILPTHNESSENSGFDVTNVVYEFPDDSEFCHSNESFPKLQKRPSDTVLENTSKKPCKENYGNPDIPADPFEATPHSLGLKYNKKEGDIEISEVTATSHSRGRFTKHKGDAMCLHGTSSSEGHEADVEDNAESLSKTSSESSESPPKEALTPIAETPLQSTLKKIVKRHIKPAPNNKKSSDSVSKTTSDIKDMNESVTKLASGNKKLDNFVKKLVSGISTSNHSEKKPAPARNKMTCPSSKDSTITRSSDKTTPIKPKTTTSAKAKPKPDTSSNSEAKKSQKSANSNKIASKSKISSDELNRPDEKSQMTEQKNKRCGVCNKKLGLTATPCRCGRIFCPIHRYDREHNCTFDYRAMGADEIRKNNPVIKGEKVRKI